MWSGHGVIAALTFLDEPYLRRQSVQATSWYIVYEYIDSGINC
jgi:hypothetical protein